MFPKAVGRDYLAYRIMGVEGKSLVLAGMDPILN
jgi:hypothetical protein